MAAHMNVEQFLIDQPSGVVSIDASELVNLLQNYRSCKRELKIIKDRLATAILKVAVLNDRIESLSSNLFIDSIDTIA